MESLESMIGWSKKKMSRIAALAFLAAYSAVPFAGCSKASEQQAPEAPVSSSQPQLSYEDRSQEQKRRDVEEEVKQLWNDTRGIRPSQDYLEKDLGRWPDWAKAQFSKDGQGEGIRFSFKELKIEDIGGSFTHSFYLPGENKICIGQIDDDADLLKNTIGKDKEGLNFIGQDIDLANLPNALLYDLRDFLKKGLKSDESVLIDHEVTHALFNIDHGVWTKPGYKGPKFEDVAHLIAEEKDPCKIDMIIDMLEIYDHSKSLKYFFVADRIEDLFPNTLSNPIEVAMLNFLKNYDPSKNIQLGKGNKPPEDVDALIKDIQDNISRDGHDDRVSFGLATTLKDGRYSDDWDEDDRTTTVVRQCATAILRDFPEYSFYVLKDTRMNFSPSGMKSSVSYEFGELEKDESAVKEAEQANTSTKEYDARLRMLVLDKAYSGIVEEVLARELTSFMNPLGARSEFNHYSLSNEWVRFFSGMTLDGEPMFKEQSEKLTLYERLRETPQGVEGIMSYYNSEIRTYTGNKSQSVNCSSGISPETISNADRLEVIQYGDDRKPASVERHSWSHNPFKFDNKLPVDECKKE